MESCRAKPCRGCIVDHIGAAQKLRLDRVRHQHLGALARLVTPVRDLVSGVTPVDRVDVVRAAPPDRAAVTASLPADLRDFARELRRHTTDAETLLWRLLRNRLMAGAKFRRQHPLPPYVLDFYCHDARLAVELDGGQHNEAAGRRHDARRDAFLAQKGIRVLRFWNHEVLNQTEAVLEAIYAAMDQAPSRVGPSPPAPLPEGEGSFHLPAHLYDIFPDRLVDSELGEIPEGWEVARFADTIEIVGGGTPKTSVAEYWDGDIPWFSVVDAPTGSEVWVVDTEKKITRAGVENSSSRVLAVGTTIISARGTVGRIALVREHHLLDWCRRGLYRGNGRVHRLVNLGEPKTAAQGTATERSASSGWLSARARACTFGRRSSTGSIQASEACSDRSGCN